MQLHWTHLNSLVATDNSLSCSTGGDRGGGGGRRERERERERRWGECVIHVHVHLNP